MSYIFLSYAREDLQRVKPLVEGLELRGWKVFWDRAIPPGKAWDKVLKAKLDGAKCIIVLWSRASVESDWVLDEAHEGKRREILIPARLDDVSPPFGFGRIHAVDLLPWPGQFEELAAAVSEFLPIAARAAPPVEEPKAPAPFAVKRHAADGLDYIWIPPGKFTMGCSQGDSECYDNEKPPHEVEITRGFWLGKTPVTQAAYEKVMKNKPSHFHGADCPVEQVSWEDAKAYCDATGLRLPTEAEWEYAARAGNANARYGELDRIAWYGGNSEAQTHPVVSKQANAWGLHDMLGNVWEWCNDWYAPYEAGAQRDPAGPKEGKYRIVRGGAWNDLPRVVRVSVRGGSVPSVRSSNFGFRCAGESV